MKEVFLDALLIEGTGRPSYEGWLIVEDGLISQVGPMGEPPDLDGGRIRNLGGAVLMPGLIDCHVHLGLDGSADPAKSIVQADIAGLALAMADRAAKTLAAGFTTVRDLGCKGHAGLAVRDAVAAGVAKGPRILSAGSMICMTGGHGWQFGREADGPHQVRRAVREEIKAGVDWVKVMATGGICTEGVEPGQVQLGPDELLVAVEETHKAGRRAAAHAQGLAGVRNSVLAGIDSVEHGTYLDEEVVDHMLSRGIYLVPTLSAGANILANGEAAGIPAFAVAKSRFHRKARLESLALAHDAGVKIAFGTDAGTPFNLHGQNAGEFKQMIASGFSAIEALSTAWMEAARLLGLDDRIGSLAPGKKADLLVVGGNPLEDVSVLSSRQMILAVYKEGRLEAGTWAASAPDGNKP